MNEDKDINALLEKEIANADNFEKKMEKQIDRRIRKSAIKTVIITVLIGALIFLGISPLMNLMQKPLRDAAKESGETPTLLTQVLAAYYETTHPCMAVADTKSGNGHFGVYDIDMNLLDLREETIIGKDNVRLKWDRGELSVESDMTGGRSSDVLGHFNMNEFYNETEMLDEFEKLPESAWIYISVSLKKAVDVDSLIQEKKENLPLFWMQVYQPKCSFQGGINLIQICSWDEEDREKMDAAGLKKQYLKNLTLLANNKKVWNGLSLYYGNTVFNNDNSKEILEENIDDLKASKGLKTKNYCLGGTKNEIIKYIKTHDIAGVAVDNVKLSSYERN